MTFPHPAERPRVLVADAHRDAADSLALLLRLWGLEPVVAHDAPSALGLFAARPPAAALVEVVRLPGAEGPELASRLRRLAGPRAVLLVAVTTAAGGAAARRSAEAGFDVHLVKPADPGLLRLTLGGWLSRRGGAPTVPVEALGR